MKNFKVIILMLLAVIMVMSATACGGKDADTASSDEVATPDSAVTETTPEPVTIGDSTIELVKVEKYVPFEDGESMLVRCKFTNNSKIDLCAADRLFITAKSGEKRILEMDYKAEHRPEGYATVNQLVAPGESLEVLYILDYVEGTVEVTIQDLFITNSEKLVFEVDTNTL